MQKPIFYLYNILIYSCLFIFMQYYSNLIKFTFYVYSYSLYKTSIIKNNIIFLYLLKIVLIIYFLLHFCLIIIIIFKMFLFFLMCICLLFLQFKISNMKYKVYLYQFFLKFHNDIKTRVIIKKKNFGFTFIDFFLLYPFYFFFIYIYDICLFFYKKIKLNIYKLYININVFIYKIIYTDKFNIYFNKIKYNIRRRHNALNIWLSDIIYYFKLYLGKFRRKVRRLIFFFLDKKEKTIYIFNKKKTKMSNFFAKVFFFLNLVCLKSKLSLRYRLYYSD